MVKAYPSEIAAFFIATNEEIKKLDNEFKIKLLREGNLFYNDPILERLSILRDCQRRLNDTQEREIFDRCVDRARSIGVVICFR